MTNHLIRGSWILDSDSGRWIPKEQYLKRRKQAREAHRLRSHLPAPQVMRDIEPFRNIAIDNAEISSRSTKREMMKRYGLEEAGTQKIVTRPVRKKRPVAQSIKKVMQQLGAPL